MPRSAKNQSCKNSCLNRSNARNEYDSRNTQVRPQRLTFSDDYYNPNDYAEDTFYSANESLIDPNLSVNNASYYTAEPGSPRNKQNMLRFAESILKRQKSRHTPFYDNAPISSRSRTLSPGRTGHDSYGSRRGDMSSGYFDRSSFNSSRGADMSSGYFDRSPVNSSRGADMSSGYFDRSQANCSRRSDMNSNYFDRNPDISPCRADMNSDYYNRSKSNLSSRHISNPGSPFTHLNRNDTTPFSFLDESQVSSCGTADMSSRFFNRTPGGANMSPRYFNRSCNRNDTTPFSYLDDSQAMSETADMSSRYFNRSPGPNCPGSPVSHLDPNDTTPFSVIHDSSSIVAMGSPYNSCNPPPLPNASCSRGSSFTRLSRHDITPVSVLVDSRDTSCTADMDSRYFSRPPSRSNKSSSCSSFYSAHETQTDDVKDSTTYTSYDSGNSTRNKNISVKIPATSTPKRGIPQQDYFDGNPQSPISRTRLSSGRTKHGRKGGDMSSGYVDRSPVNSSRGADMTSGYFDRSQANSSRGTDMSSGFNRSTFIAPRFDRSCPGGSFTHINRNDTTPFSFLDESQASSCDRAEMISRYLNRCSGRFSPRPVTHISRNDGRARSCPGNPSYSTSSSFLDINQANSCAGADISSDYLDRTNENDFSFINDANDYLQYYDSCPQKTSKAFYSAPNVCSNLK